MRSSAYLVGLVTVLVVLVLVTGCPKPPPETGPTSAPSAKAPSTEAPTPAPEVSAPKPASKGDDLASITALRKNLTSYIMTMTVAGKPVRQATKLANGKPVRIKSEVGKPGSFMLIEIDKQENYMYDAAKKTAMKMPVKPGAPGSTAGGSADADLAKLEAQHPKVTSATLGGIDCWLIELAGEKGAPSQTWIDKKYGLVRQFKSGQTSMKMAYDKINAVPDSEFELPKGTKIVSVPGAPSVPIKP